VATRRRFGEATGLGGAILLGAAGVRYVGEGSGFLAALVLAAVAVLAGTLIEGTVVGTAQWLVLKEPLPLMRQRIRVLATGAGAFLAWTLAGLMLAANLDCCLDQSRSNTGQTRRLERLSRTRIGSPGSCISRRTASAPAPWPPSLSERRDLMPRPGLCLASMPCCYPSTLPYFILADELGRDRDQQRVALPGDKVAARSVCRLASTTVLDRT